MNCSQLVKYSPTKTRHIAHAATVPSPSPSPCPLTMSHVAHCEVGRNRGAVFTYALSATRYCLPNNLPGLPKKSPTKT